MLHQIHQVSPYRRLDETTTSTFPGSPKSATKKQAQLPQNGIFLLKRYKAADSTNMTPSHSSDSPMTIFIRRQKNPIYMRLHICFYRPSIRVRAQRIKIITFVPPFSLISVFVCFEQKKAVSFTLTTISTIAQTRLYCQLHYLRFLYSYSHNNETGTAVPESLCCLKAGISTQSIPKRCAGIVLFLDRFKQFVLTTRYHYSFSQFISTVISSAAPPSPSALPPYPASRSHPHIP